MRSLSRGLAPVVFAAVLMCPVLIVGCSPAPVYTDSAHNDTHRWDSHEADLYAQWERETHREHVDYQRRADTEQKEYWDWRHRH